jgi:hypothetical protein
MGRDKNLRHSLRYKPLVATRQLATPERVGRRTEDTAVLLFEIIAGDMESDRWILPCQK